MYSEEQLVEGCSKGKRHYQQALYERYASGMFAVCKRYCPMEQEAEDVLQESFIKVFDRIGQFRKESSLGWWIKRIVVNTALNANRSKLYLYPMVDVQELNQADGQGTNLEQYQMQELLEMIRSLPDGCRVIFNLYAIEGYKHHEVAKMLNISEGTSKSQYARARSLLRSKMNEQEEVKLWKG